MEFESESDMKKVVQEEFPDLLGAERDESIDEFDYGPGRTDLVFLRVSENYWRRRTQDLNIKDAIENEQQLQTFLQLHKRDEVTEEYFYSIGALSCREKRQSLEHLRDKGFIQDLGDKIRTVPRLRPHVTTSFAVELKLKKWKEALQQAYRSRSFANYRYVILDSDHVNPALDRLQMFREKEVGLCSISNDGIITQHYNPERQDPYSSFTRWKLNETSVLNTNSISASD